MSLVVLPASALASEGQLLQLEEWVAGGGHAVILFQRAESHWNDWNDNFGRSIEPPEAVDEWLAAMGIEWRERDFEELLVEGLVWDGERFEVSIEPRYEFGLGGEEAEVLESREVGVGRLTLMVAAKPFRSRYIDEYDHAALLVAMARVGHGGGGVAFVRGVGLSFWGLLWSHGWPVLVALIGGIVFWLWRSLPRFGPLDSVEAGGTLRAYDHHLEALGDFHWRLDRAQGLLAPLRAGLIERAQHLAMSTGRADADLFELVAGRSELSRERVERALTIERPRDPAAFTRLAADLQTIHRTIP